MNEPLTEKRDLPKVGAVIVARMTSSRFPGKSLADLSGRPALARMIDRVRCSARIGKIVVATTVNESDRPIAALAERLGVACFRGSEEDVLGRVLGAVRSAGLDVAVHLTGDCPLVDPAIIDQVVALFFAEQADYAKNFQWGDKADPRLSYPNGLDVEVFRTEALAEVDRRVADPWLREHVTEPLYTWPQFRAVTLPAPPALARPDLRICLDTREDHAVIQAIFAHFRGQEERFSAADVVSFLDAHPELRARNRQVSQRKYTAAVVGLGLIGSLYDRDEKMAGIQTHSGAYLRWSKTRLVAGCDPDPAKREAFTAHWGVRAVFADARDLLAEAKPEIVSICTPAESHGALIRLCLEGGVKAILCEKPFVREVAEGEALVAACREAGVPLAVNHWMRYADLYRGLKGFLAEGGLGTLWGGRYHYSKGAMNSGSHAVDILAYLLGEVVAVRTTDGRPLDGADGNLGGVLTFAGGQVVHLTVGDYRDHFTTELDLMGSQGRIRIADDDRTVEWHGVADSDHQSGVRVLQRREPLPFETQRGAFMVQVVANLVDALEGRAPLWCTGEDGLMAVKVIRALQLSAGNGGRSEVVG